MTLLAFERSRAWHNLNWNVQAHASQHHDKSAMLSLEGEQETAELSVTRLGRRVDLRDELGISHATLASIKLGPALTLGDPQIEDNASMTGNGIGFWTKGGKVIYAAGRK